MSDVDLGDGITLSFPFDVLGGNAVVVGSAIAALVGGIGMGRTSVSFVPSARDRVEVVVPRKSVAGGAGVGTLLAKGTPLRIDWTLFEIESLREPESTTSLPTHAVAAAIRGGMTASHRFEALEIRQTVAKAVVLLYEDLRVCWFWSQIPPRHYWMRLQ